MYLGLAEVFTKSLENEASNVRLVAEASEADRWFKEDCNVGLVKQVIDAYRFFSIRQLGNTYAALPITEVTQRTSHDGGDHAETGNYLDYLISTGRLNASVAKPTNDPTSWILRFHESGEEGPLSRTEEQELDDLTQQMAKVHRLMQQIKEADRKLGLSKEYTQELRRARDSKQNGQPDSVDAWSGNAEPAIDLEEDMMAD